MPGFLSSSFPLLSSILLDVIVTHAVLLVEGELGLARRVAEDLDRRHLKAGLGPREDLFPRNLH